MSVEAWGFVMVVETPVELELGRSTVCIEILRGIAGRGGPHCAAANANCGPCNRFACVNCDKAPNVDRDEFGWWSVDTNRSSTLSLICVVDTAR